MKFTLILLFFLFTQVDVPPTDGLVLTPLQQSTTETSEYVYTSHHNSLGFRGEEVSTTKPANTCRIVVVGDRFTYGQGLADDETWVYRAEQNLKAEGKAVEILNLSALGMQLATLVELAKTANERLNPDAFVVAMLQTDDINTALLPVEKLPRLDEVLLTAEDNRSRWLEQVERIVTKLTPEVMPRYDAMDAEAKAMFLRGNLNPYMVELALFVPDLWINVLDTQNPNIIVNAEAMQEHFESLSQMEKPVLLVNLPYGVYIEREILETRAALGFNVSDEMLRTTIMDDIPARAAESVGLPFFTVTEAFRESEGGNYYRWDGHLNRQGSQFFADLITAELETLCDEEKQE